MLASQVRDWGRRLSLSLRVLTFSKSKRGRSDQSFALSRVLQERARLAKASVEFTSGHMSGGERERERATVPADCALLSIMMPECSWLSCYTQGKYLDAERLYKRSRDIQEKVLGPRHPDVAVVLNNSAVLLEERVRDVCTEKYIYIFVYLYTALI